MEPYPDGFRSPTTNTEADFIAANRVGFGDNGFDVDIRDGDSAPADIPLDDEARYETAKEHLAFAQQLAAGSDELSAAIMDTISTLRN
jgi:hypothetical protein